MHISEDGNKGWYKDWRVLLRECMAVIQILRVAYGLQNITHVNYRHFEVVSTVPLWVNDSVYSYLLNVCRLD